VLCFGAVAVADVVACTVTVLFWLCCCSGVDASASPTAGAAEDLNIAGAADATAVAFLALFLVLHVLFPIAQLSNFTVEK